MKRIKIFLARGYHHMPKNHITLFLQQEAQESARH
jgi:hypothetical protein